MIIITGSSGFIGSNFIEYFLKKKIKFIGLDKIENKYLKSKYFKKINLLNKKKLTKIFSTYRPKTIIHLAANSGLNYCHTHRNEAFKNNIEVTANLLELCLKYKCKNILVASSMAAEKFSLVPSFYGFTKLSTENLIKTYKDIYGLNSTVLRFSNIFGPFSNHKSSAIHQMIKCIFDKKILFNIHGSGNQKRDFLFSRDLVTKTLKISKKKNRKLIYNVNTNTKYSINQVFSLINSLSRSSIKFRKIKAPVGYDVKVDKTKDLNISVNFKNNLKKTINWYKKYL